MAKVLWNNDLLLNILLQADCGHTLARCELVCTAWKRAGAEQALEASWRKAYLRMSPVAPIAFEDAAIGSPTFVCTPFTNPTVKSPLARAAADSIAWRQLFSRRMRAAAAAAANLRVVGECEVIWPAWIGRQQKYCCTRIDDDGKEATPAKFEDLSFTFELFECDKESKRRGECNREEWHDEDSQSEGSETFEYDGSDYITDAIKASFAGPPHFAGNKFENLIWCSTVRGDSSSSEVRAMAPCMAPDTGGMICRRTSVGIYTGMDDPFWCDPYRMVVTVTRDTDGKMCQIVDVNGRNGEGFKERDLDGDTGGSIDVTVVDEPPGEDKGVQLDMDCYFGANLSPNFDLEDINDQIEPPGDDLVVDKGWKIMERAAGQTLGALHALSITWSLRNASGEMGDCEEPTPEKVAEMLGMLQWH